MRRIRIVTTATLAAAVLGAAIASAAAQSAGAPLPLLQFSHPKSKTKPAAHPKLETNKVVAKSEHKPVAKRRIARRPTATPPQAVAAVPQTPEPAGADALPANAQPANTWPTAGTVAPGLTGTLAPPQPGPAVPTASVVQTSPNEIVSGGQAVLVTSPDQINAADLAADNHPQTANEPAPNTAATADPATSPPAATAMVARASVEKPETPSPVGSASWIAQVLAALGGALAAGIVAWFLIRPAPIRTYG